MALSLGMSAFTSASCSACGRAGRQRTSAKTPYTCRECHRANVAGLGGTSRERRAARRASDFGYTCAACGVRVERECTRGRKPAYCTPCRLKPGQWISDTIRFRLYIRDGWTCQICHEPIDKTAHFLDPWSATLDHIVPRSKGGDDAPQNLRTAHRWCNAILGDKTLYSDSDLAPGSS